MLSTIAINYIKEIINYIHYVDLLDNYISKAYINKIIIDNNTIKYKLLDAGNFISIINSDIETWKSRLLQIYNNLNYNVYIKDVVVYFNKNYMLIVIQI